MRQRREPGESILQFGESKALRRACRHESADQIVPRIFRFLETGGPDKDAAAGAGAHPPARCKTAIRGTYGIGMDLQMPREFAHAGQFLAGFIAPAQYAEEQLRAQLLLEGDRRPSRQPDSHCYQCCHGSDNRGSRSRSVSVRLSRKAIRSIRFCGVRTNPRIRLSRLGFVEARPPAE